MSTPTVNGERLMTRDEYCAKRGITLNTEANHRNRGVSPPYLAVPVGRYSRIFYSAADVEAWLLEHVVR